mmetsp:Transcript_47663/g.153302  ORF Transcript_47663/g.153302 Transcript_47663/m.153302 type:complete len:729 (-) Transcript_47663:115-2301(-)
MAADAVAGVVGGAAMLWEGDVVVAVKDVDANSEGYLPLRRSDEVQILHIGALPEESDWLYGCLIVGSTTGARGWLPRCAVVPQPASRPEPEARTPSSSSTATAPTAAAGAVAPAAPAGAPSAGGGAEVVADDPVLAVVTEAVYGNQVYMALAVGAQVRVQYRGSAAAGDEGWLFGRLLDGREGWFPSTAIAMERAREVTPDPALVPVVVAYDGDVACGYLRLHVGDQVRIRHEGGRGTDEEGWLFGSSSGGGRGWFPASALGDRRSAGTAAATASARADPPSTTAAAAAPQAVPAAVPPPPSAARSAPAAPTPAASCQQVFASAVADNADEEEDEEEAGRRAEEVEHVRRAVREAFGQPMATPASAEPVSGTVLVHMRRDGPLGSKLRAAPVGTEVAEGAASVRPGQEVTLLSVMPDWAYVKVITDGRAALGWLRRENLHRPEAVPEPALPAPRRAPVSALAALTAPTATVEPAAALSGQPMSEPPASVQRTKKPPPPPGSPPANAKAAEWTPEPPQMQVRATPDAPGMVAVPRQPEGRAGTARIFTLGLENSERELVDSCNGVGGATLHVTKDVIRGAMQRLNLGRVEVVADARQFSDPAAIGALTRHLGMHPEIMKRMVDFRPFGHWIREIRDEVNAARKTSETVGIAIYCRKGKHRSVAGSWFVEHCLKADGWTVTMQHLAEKRWEKCCRGQCAECRGLEPSVANREEALAEALRQWQPSRSAWR